MRRIRRPNCVTPIFITNAPRAFETVLGRWDAADLPEGMRIADPRVAVATAMKRSIDHVNALALGNDRWIVGTGTYVTYSGKIGGDALEEIWRAADLEAPLEVRDLLFGHYAIAMRSGNRIVVFYDAIASYELYFWTDPADGGTFLASNFLSDVLSHPAIRPKVSDFDAIKAAYHGERGIGRHALFDGVLSVEGTSTSRSRSATGTPAPPCATWRVRRAGRRLPRSMPCLATNVAESDRIFAALTAFSTIAINCTGGLDSRLLIAAAHRHDLAPVLLYGAGNSRMTNTRAEDLEAARMVSEAYGWPLHVMDWRQDRPYTEEKRRELHAKYGFKQPYGSTEDLLRCFEGGIAPYPDLQMGGYNPAFTNLKPWSWEGEGIALRGFLARFAADYIDVFASETSRNAYLDRLSADFADLAADLGVVIEDGRLPREDFVRLLIHGRAPKEAFNLNAFNQFAYYLDPYFTTMLFSCLVAVPPDWRRGDRFQLHAIAANCDHALDFPIFSGLKRYRLDREAMTMHTVDPSSGHGIVQPCPSGRGIARRVALKVLGVLQRRGVPGPPRRSGEAPTDATPQFRHAARAALDDAGPSGNIDNAAFAQKDLRAVYRYLTAREIAGKTPGT